MCAFGAEAKSGVRDSTVRRKERERVSSLFDHDSAGKFAGAISQSEMFLSISGYLAGRFAGGKLNCCQRLLKLSEFQLNRLCGGWLSTISEYRPDRVLVRPAFSEALDYEQFGVDP